MRAAAVSRIAVGLDALIWPIVYPAALLLKVIRRGGSRDFRRCHRVLLRVGVFPIRDHYYEPQFDFRDEPTDFAAPRALPGIDWNIEGQLELLAAMTRIDEARALEHFRIEGVDFDIDNEQFGPGDVEFWYQLIRLKRPRRIVEIGSGNSTLVARLAVAANLRDDPLYECEHVCIEPYEMSWLERTGVQVVRERVERMGTELFASLDESDILFIDSSHVIRPAGDVTFEYLQLLPTLRAGVVVHIHDIFSPRNYPDAWIRSDVRLWNEQYLLEAFLCHNDQWRVLAALNLLGNDHHDALAAACPLLAPGRQPGSIYLERVER
jgi:predicted O-methyltransferase YrrM